MENTVPIEISEYKKLITENAKMKVALETVKTYAANAAFGGWRHDVHSMAKKGLGQ